MYIGKPLKFILLIFLVYSCSLQNDLDIQQPPYQKQIVVESYLIPGKPFVVSLSESVPYLDSPQVPRINNATVVISYLGKSDTLFETTDGIYISKDTVPEDFETTFFLYVSDANGRTVTSNTKITKPVELDSIKFLFGTVEQAATVLYFTDPEPGILNYFGVYIIRNVNHTDVFSDLDFDGIIKPYQTDFKYKENEKLGVQLIHISKEFHDFINTMKSAYESNLRPITEPVAIKSNITGGLGIFTGFSFKSHAVTVTR